jgi:putative resolvase
MSSSDQREDLERQVGRLATWAAAQGPRADRRDRGGRVGFEWVADGAQAAVGRSDGRDGGGGASRGLGRGTSRLLCAQGRRLVVVEDQEEVDDDLVRDITGADLDVRATVRAAVREAPS